jgi:hypothetical protein
VSVASPYPLDAEVDVEVVAPLDDDVALFSNDGSRLQALSLDVHGRGEPFTEAEVVDVLPQPPLDVRRRRLPGRDDFVGKRARDQAVRNPHQVAIGGEHLRDADLDVLEREVLRANDPRHPRPESRFEQLALPRREPVGERVRVGDVERNSLRLAVVDDLAQHGPLRISPELAVLDVRVPVHSVEPAVRSAAERKPLDPLLGTPVVEDENRATTRREERR